MRDYGSFEIREFRGTETFSDDEAIIQNGWFSKKYFHLGIPLNPQNNRVYYKRKQASWKWTRQGGQNEFGDKEIWRQV